MVKRHPDSATITWKDAGSKDGDGVYTEGTSHTKTISCVIQPQSGRYLVNADGDRIDYSYVIFSNLFDGAGDIPDNARISILGKDFKIIRLDPYQKHIEIRC